VAILPLQINNMKSRLKQYFELLEANKRTTWQMLGAVNDEMFHWKKDAKNWSLSQVLDHVIFSEESALNYCNKKLLAGDDIPNATFFNSLKIRVYFLGLKTRLKFKAPKLISNPDNSKSLEEQRKRWDNLRKDYEEFLKMYPQKYLDKAVFRHPLAGRIRLDEMLKFLSTHIVHHQFQISRIIDSYERFS
jgi:uncharacterized damage-inducible protein DinB